jgi:hypothetical protein
VVHLQYYANVNPYVSGFRDEGASRLEDGDICTLGSPPEKVVAAIEHRLGIFPMSPEASCRLLIPP